MPPGMGSIASFWHPVRPWPAVCACWLGCPAKLRCLPERPPSLSRCHTSTPVPLTLFAPVSRRRLCGWCRHPLSFTVDANGTNGGRGTVLEISLLARALTGVLGIAVVDAHTGVWASQLPFCHPSSPGCVRILYARATKHGQVHQGACVAGEHIGDVVAAAPAAPLPHGGPVCGDVRQHSPDRPASGKTFAAGGAGSDRQRRSAGATPRCGRPKRSDNGAFVTPGGLGSTAATSGPSPCDSGYGGSPPTAMQPLDSSPGVAVVEVSRMSLTVAKGSIASLLSGVCEDPRWPAELSRRPARIVVAAAVLRDMVSAVGVGTSVESPAFDAAVAPTCHAAAAAAAAGAEVPGRTAGLYSMCSTGVDVVRHGGMPGHVAFRLDV